MQNNKILRIPYLDGMRGIAILLVIIFHAYARWPKIVPYGERFGDFFLAKYGWLGVELFFMISGFVIYMTLEKCNKWYEFFFKRWLRLFPAMFVITFIIFFTANFFFERPAGIPSVLNVIPGIFFVDPAWIYRVTGLQVPAIEGAFWSLFIEVKFYLVFGCCYYIFGIKKAKSLIYLIYFIFILSFILNKFVQIQFVNTIIGLLNFLSGAKFLGYFIIGMLSFELYRDQIFDYKKLTIVFIVGVLSSFSLCFDKNDYSFLFSIFLILLFASCFYVKFFQNLVSFKFFTFLGFVSYPLYLIHENMMISMIVKIGNRFNFISDVIIPVIPVLFVVFVAFVVARFIEPYFRDQLRLIIYSFFGLK